MKKFAFRLAPLLALREQAQENCEKALAESVSAVKAASSHLQQLRQTHATLNRKWLDLYRRDAQDPAEIIHFSAYRRLLEQRLKEGQERLDERQAEEAARRAELLEARKAVRILEKLRERQVTAHRQILTQREQAELDEHSVCKIARRKTAPSGSQKV